VQKTRHVQRMSEFARPRPLHAPQRREEGSLTRFDSNLDDALGHTLPAGSPFLRRMSGEEAGDFIPPPISRRCRCGEAVAFNTTICDNLGWLVAIWRESGGCHGRGSWGGRGGK